MKLKDLETGVVYGWSRNRDVYYGTSPMVFLSADLYGDRDSWTRKGKMFHKVMNATSYKPRAGQWGNSDYGYPVAMLEYQTEPTDENIAMLLTASLDEMLTLEGRSPAGKRAVIRYTLLTSLSHVKGIYAELEADRARASAEHARRSEEARQEREAEEAAAAELADYFTKLNIGLSVRHSPTAVYSYVPVEIEQLAEIRDLVAFLRDRADGYTVSQILAEHPEWGHSEWFPKVD